MIQNRIPEGVHTEFSMVIPAGFLEKKIIQKILEGIDGIQESSKKILVDSWVPSKKQGTMFEENNGGFCLRFPRKIPEDNLGKPLKQL